MRTLIHSESFCNPGKAGGNGGIGERVCKECRTALMLKGGKGSGMPKFYVGQAHYALVNLQ